MIKQNYLKAQVRVNKKKRQTVFSQKDVKNAYQNNTWMDNHTPSMDCGTESREYTTISKKNRKKNSRSICEENVAGQRRHGTVE